MISGARYLEEEEEGGRGKGIRGNRREEETATYININDCAYTVVKWNSYIHWNIQAGHIPGERTTQIVLCRYVRMYIWIGMAHRKGTLHKVIDQIIDCKREWTGNVL